MNTVFKQAIDEMFPQFNERQRKEIFETMSVHMLEFLKQQIYKDDLQGLRNLELEENRIKDEKEKENYYEKGITKKLELITEENIHNIILFFNKELTRVMHELHQAAN